MFALKWWTAIVTAFVLLAVSPCARADDGNKYLNQTKLEEGLDLLAAQIVDVLTKREAKELRFGEIVCPSNKDDPHGAWLQRDLTVRIEKRKVSISPKATYDLRVEYGYERRDGAVSEVYILASLRKGNENVELPKLNRIPSDDMRDKLRMAAFCVSLSPSDSKQDRDNAFCDARKAPSVHLSGDTKSRISASAKSKYYVELLVGPKDGKEKRERTATVQDGYALAKIDKDEEYQLRIVNNSTTEAACRVFIDGIDIFEFTDDRQKNGEPMYKHIIVPSGEKGVEVPGWHKTAAKDRKDNWRAFVVTEFGQGAASRVNPKGPIGTIKVVFAESYDPNDGKIKGRAAAMETGFGRDINGPQEVLPRKIDPPHECVVIHYTRRIEPEK